MTTPVRSLVRRPITVAPTTTIREAAQLMRDQRVSSVLLVEQGHLFGLVTDRDLRNRAVAQGWTPAPVIDIATVAPLTMDGASRLRGAAADGAPQHPPRAGDGRHAWPA
jgi:CBS domain-containing protein